MAAKSGSAAAMKGPLHVQLHNGKIARVFILLSIVIVLKLATESWTIHHTHPQQLPSSNVVPSTVLNTIIPRASARLQPLLNMSNINYVYMIGRDRPFSRTNNQLMAIIRALDLIFDQHGELSNETTAVLGIGGWARDVLKQFFFNDKKHRDWSARLESLVPIITLDRVRSLPGKPIVLTNYTGPDCFKYHTQPPYGSKLQVIQTRRQEILGPLFRNPSYQTWHGYKLLQDYMSKMAVFSNNSDQLPYMVIHSRNLEGSCVERLGNLLPPDECDMNPTYMKRLLRRYNLLGRIAIVVISDFQNVSIIRNLQQDTEIGKYIVVPAWDIAEWNNETANDMMVAIRSDYFVGTRVSTMALMIGLARVVTGKDPKTNLVYVDEKLNVCEDCIYYCNPKQTTVCGGRTNATHIHVVT